MQRREFLAGAALAAAATGAASPAQFHKSICSGIFPAEMPLEEQFRRARDAGFEGIELRFGQQVKPDASAEELKRLRESATKAGITIVSLWVSGPLEENPLNSPDAEKRARGDRAIERCIECAAALGCGAMLIVPGRLGTGARFEIGYQDTWERVTAEFRKLIPHAAAAQVCLTPENVWNKFLVSPLEMRAFIDQFHSPWLQAHFDIGNVMQFGYPEDWILTLGPRIRRVHVKDYKLSTRAEQGRFVDLLEGDVNWKGVMAALVKVGYRGFLSPEIGYRAQVPDQLKKVSEALDRILAMA
jgi:L-ribulose-5-phosphate 3-epimerase